MGFSTTKGSKKAFPWAASVVLTALINMKSLERETERAIREEVVNSPEISVARGAEKDGISVIAHQGEVRVPVVAQVEVKAFVPSRR